MGAAVKLAAGQQPLVVTAPQRYGLLPAEEWKRRLTDRAKVVLGALVILARGAREVTASIADLCRACGWHERSERKVRRALAELERADILFRDELRRNFIFRFRLRGRDRDILPLPADRSNLTGGPVKSDPPDRSNLTGGDGSPPDPPYIGIKREPQQTAAAASLPFPEGEPVTDHEFANDLVERILAIGEPGRLSRHSVEANVRTWDMDELDAIVSELEARGTQIVSMNYLLPIRDERRRIAAAQAAALARASQPKLNDDAASISGAAFLDALNEGQRAAGASEGDLHRTPPEKTPAAGPLGKVPPQPAGTHSERSSSELTAEPSVERRGFEPPAFALRRQRSLVHHTSNARLGQTEPENSPPRLSDVRIESATLKPNHPDCLNCKPDSLRVQSNFLDPGG